MTVNTVWSCGNPHVNNIDGNKPTQSKEPKNTKCFPPPPKKKQMFWNHVWNQLNFNSCRLPRRPPSTHFRCAGDCSRGTATSDSSLESTNGEPNIKLVAGTHSCVRYVSGLESDGLNQNVFVWSRVGFANCYLELYCTETWIKSYWLLNMLNRNMNLTESNLCQ